MSYAPTTPVMEQSRNLTPPCTPPQHPTKQVPAATEDERQKMPGPNACDDPGNAVTPIVDETLSWEMISPRSCTKKYQLSLSPSSGYEVLGHGAWSTVYRATEMQETPLSALLTPPTSPINISSKPATGRVLAIKAPARKDAHDILYHEARVLTYLHSFHRASSYIVAFHGFVVASQSLVMHAIPMNLEAHANTCLKNARTNFATRTMFDPVCGPQGWRSLTTQLIDGLEFLHSKNCVHGDIKPSNVLLQPNENSSPETYTPLYCDFSSSRILEDSNVSNAEQAQRITALTPDYASPELLTSLRSTAAVATTAADVYALAVTLLVAAIGESPYAGTNMDMLKLSMVREGRVLEFARQAEQGTRIMKGKMVDLCLKSALEKDVAKRSTAKEWRHNVHAIIQE
ncbi:MAG: hypothetical protein Q9209_000507 [Squamulea sp. 1 TL-2023]